MYQVACIAVSGKGNKVFKYGEKVTEDQFPRGNAEALVKSGHLVNLSETVEAPVVEEINVEDSQAPEMNHDEVEKLPYKEITANQMRELLGVDRDKKMSKKDLYEVYLNS